MNLAASLFLISLGVISNLTTVLGCPERCVCTPAFAMCRGGIVNDRFVRFLLPVPKYDLRGCSILQNGLDLLLSKPTLTFLDIRGVDCSGILFSGLNLWSESHTLFHSCDLSLSTTPVKPLSIDGSVSANSKSVSSVISPVLSTQKEAFETSSGLNLSFIESTKKTSLSVSVSDQSSSHPPTSVPVGRLFTSEVIKVSSPDTSVVVTPNVKLSTFQSRKGSTTFSESVTDNDKMTNSLPSIVTFDNDKGVSKPSHVSGEVFQSVTPFVQLLTRYQSKVPYRSSSVSGFSSVSQNSAPDISPTTFVYPISKLFSSPVTVSAKIDTLSTPATPLEGCVCPITQEKYSATKTTDPAQFVTDKTIKTSTLMKAIPTVAATTSVQDY